MLIVALIIASLMIMPGPAYSALRRSDTMQQRSRASGYNRGEHLRHLKSSRRATVERRGIRRDIDRGRRINRYRAAQQPCVTRQYPATILMPVIIPYRKARLFAEIQALRAEIDRLEKLIYFMP